MSESGSVDRAFAILELFERERRPLLLKELAEFCDIPASTCYNLVQTLLRRAYLYQSGGRKDLYPTRRLFDMGAAILASDPLLHRVEPIMEQLRDKTRETVILGKRQKDVVVYLDVCESPEVIRYSARAGDTKPLQSTCIGKSMLSTMKPADMTQWLASHPARKVTANTIVDARALSADIETGRQQGYFMTRGENVSDVTALAVLIHLNNEAYGLAVAGPSHRIDARRDELAKALKRAQASLLKLDCPGRTEGA